MFLFLNPTSMFIIRTKLGHSLSYKIACAPSEDSDQPVQQYKLTRLTVWVIVYPVCSANSDQPVQIFTFAGHTGNLVGNAVPQFN